MAFILFTPFLTAVYNQERSMLETIYIVNKEILQKNLRPIIKSGFKSRAGNNGACTVTKNDASQPKSYLLLLAAAIHNSRAQKRLTPGVIPTQFLVSQSFHSWSRWSVGGRLWLQGTFGSDYGSKKILKEKS